jgi:hypothetical protein
MTRVAVLLGAGASVDAGIPDTTQMTKRLVEAVGSARWSSPSVVTALNFVVATLNARDTLHGSGPFDTVDVERVFSAIEALGSRNELDISAFVSSWSSDILQVDRDDAQLSSLAGALRGHILDTRFPNERQIADTLRNFVEKMTGTGSGPIFQQTLRVMIDELREILRVQSDKSVSYLRPLADLARDQPNGLVVATLNYDLTVETMSQAAGIGCTTGIDNWSATGAWDFPRDGIRLLKLHGSIDWLLELATPKPGFLSQQRISVGDQSGPRDRPAIVFGQTKLRPDGPFIELLLEFARALDTVDHLVVVGYSFRDDHVNEQVRRWINAESSRTITVVDPSFSLEARGYVPHEDFRTHLYRSLIPEGPTFIGANPEPIPPPPGQDFAARLEVVRETAAAALSRVLGS